MSSREQRATILLQRYTSFDLFFLAFFNSALKHNNVPFSSHDKLIYDLYISEIYIYSMNKYKFPMGILIKYIVDLPMTVIPAFRLLG